MLHDAEYVRLSLAVAEMACESREAWYTYGKLSAQKLHHPELATEETEQARESALATAQLWNERLENAITVLVAYKLKKKDEVPAC